MGIGANVVVASVSSVMLWLSQYVVARALNNHDGTRAHVRFRRSLHVTMTRASLPSLGMNAKSRK